MWVNDDKTFTFGWTDKLVLQIVYFFCVGIHMSLSYFVLRKKTLQQEEVQRSQEVQMIQGMMKMTVMKTAMKTVMMMMMMRVGKKEKMKNLCP